MLDIFYKGGPLMYPIFLCSILAFAIFFERVWTYWGIQRSATNLTLEIETLVRKDHVVEALAICQSRRTMMSSIFVVALNAAGLPRDQVKTFVEEVGSRHSASLDRYLGLLGTIATISPLLGLLGTVLGMIRAFTQLSLEGVGSPATLGGGISEALITTATGLAVAIPTILLHKYLTSRSDSLSNQVEIYAMQMVDLVSAEQHIS
ncbi:MAG: flagellar motor protein MotA [Desulfobacteraceae bacterium 4572_35.2]|nr:MAG: flagellar motor protein MotA [Desulfobacteraceae bacterium 4572_35.2]